MFWLFPGSFTCNAEWTVRNDKTNDGDDDDNDNNNDKYLIVTRDEKLKTKWHEMIWRWIFGEMGMIWSASENGAPYWWLLILRHCWMRIKIKSEYGMKGDKWKIIMTSDIKNTEPCHYQWISPKEERRETEVERSDERDVFQVFHELWSRDCKRISVVSISTKFNSSLLNSAYYIWKQN